MIQEIYEYSKLYNRDYIMYHVQEMWHADKFQTLLMAGEG